MASATDIITYIGIPLAVLGVLPILYTSFFSLLTLRAIRKLLVRNGHVPSSVYRSSKSKRKRGRTGGRRGMSWQFWQELLPWQSGRRLEKDKDSIRDIELQAKHEDYELGSTVEVHDEENDSDELLGVSNQGGGRGKNGFTIRGSPMATLIEIDLPLYILMPLPRMHPEYWALNTAAEGRSLLPGGSYTTFHWRKMVMGRKLIRVQYLDEVREPAAEVDFEDLVKMMLDLGAKIDDIGWEGLRRMGLWTPSGTVLLRPPTTDGDVKHVETPKLTRRADDWVLRTSVPDESDGVLSLTCQWKKQWMFGRGLESLPPGWGRLDQPRPLDPEDTGLAGRVAVLVNMREQRRSESFRFEITNNRIHKVNFEHDKAQTGDTCQLDPDRPESLWLTCAAAAMTIHKQHVGLWRFELPPHISTFSKLHNIPCGVMVVLGLMTDIDIPSWETPEDSRHTITGAEKYHRRAMDRMRKMRLEQNMPPEQAAAARRARMEEERWQIQDDMTESMNAQKDKEEKRIKDALASPKLSNRAVAEACLAWLVDKKQIPADWSVEALAEAVLYLMTLDTSEASKIANTLDEWVAWSQSGNSMMKSQMNMLADNKEQFCWASALVCVIEEAVKTTGKMNEDMMECMRIWKRARLG